MRPVSDEFLRVVRGSHRMVAEARVVTGHPTGVDPAGVSVPILSGDVQFDATADIRATLEVETDGAGMWPADAADPLAPFGNELFVRRGIAYGNGVVEWVSLGYYRINTPEQAEAPDGPIRVSAADRMAGIVDARLVEPRQFVAGTTLGAVVDELVREVYPAAVIEWDDSTSLATLARSHVAEENRHEFLDDLITSMGKVWFWDHRGVLVIRTPPDPADPVVDVDAGAGGVLVSVSRGLSRDGVYNAVVASGEAADTEPPVRAVAYDDNPASPTYWHGPFGKVPRFYSSPFVTTEAQAHSAAESLLRRSLGLPYQVDLSAVPNPALEVDDPVRVRYPERSRGRHLRTETHVISALTVPLTAAQPMTAKTREQTLVVIGRA